jgi:thiamine transport system permease protein
MKDKKPPFAHQHKSLIRIGLGVALFLLGLGLTAILALAWHGNGDFLGGFDQRTGYVLKSAFVQASLSVVFSFLIALPAAIALNRTSHWRWTKLMEMMLGLALVIPTTVAAGGLIAIWGRTGFLSSICNRLNGIEGCGGLSIYGLHGVILAHMFFNVPLLIRIFLPLLGAVPVTHDRLAALLNLKGYTYFRHIEWPQLRSALPASSLLVFLFCFTSFSLVLMLGGGPKVTTMEVEIYAAIRFSFDLTSASGLSLLQFALASLVVSAMAFLNRRQSLVNTSEQAFSPKRGREERTHLPYSPSPSLWLFMMHALLVVLIALPVIMVIARGLDPVLFNVISHPAFINGLGTSLSIAVGSAITVTSLAFLLAGARAGLVTGQEIGSTRKSMALILIDGGIMLYLVIPSIVLGTSAFILLRSAGDIFSTAWIVVVAANTLLALPLAIRLLETRMTKLFRQQNRLALLLGIHGLARWRLITLPLLEREIGLVLGLSAALSVGDFGVIALFASQDFQTLPWMLYQASGRYASDQAAALAFILLGVTIILLLSGQFAARLVRVKDITNA